MTAPYIPPPDQQTVMQTLLGLIGQAPKQKAPRLSILEQLQAHMHQLAEAARAATSSTDAREIPAGYLDTLAQIAGHPNAIVRTPEWFGSVMRTPLGGASGGLYFPGADVVTVDRAMADSRELLAHEMGHRYDFAHPDDVANRAASRAPDAPMMWKKDRNYASANRSEQKATAFANAQEMIDRASELANMAATRTAPDAARFAPAARHYFSKRLADSERQAPGTIALLNMMLAHPIYAHHPVQAFRDLVPPPIPDTPDLAPTDATRVR